MQKFVKKLIERLEETDLNDIQMVVREVLLKYGFPYESVVQDEIWNALDELSTNKFAIQIVNQLAEEYNNDFCEWKKTDKRKSSPYHHALKHGNITLEFHDDFKICPYCGKKIKVVE